MSETATERIYRTADGELVDGGDERAAFLAYAEGDELTAAHAAEWKRRKTPTADKQRRAPANKGTAKKPAGDGALPPKTAGDAGGGKAGPGAPAEETNDDGQADAGDGTGSGLKVDGGAAEPGADPQW